LSLGSVERYTWVWKRTQDERLSKDVLDHLGRLGLSEVDLSLTLEVFITGVLAQTDGSTVEDLGQT
jgi:hypothetical protein